MNKIKRLRITRTAEKYAGHGFALMTAGFVGASIAMKAFTDQPITVPVILSFGCVMESCLFYAQSTMSDIRIICNESMKNNNVDKVKVLTKN